MKTILSLTLSLMIGVHSFSQVSVNSSGVPPDPSAMLDVHSTDKGLLVPRLTESQRLTITQPANALLVYQVDGANGFYYNQGNDVTPDWQLLGGDDLILSSRIPIDSIPYTITESGSYYLTSHAEGMAGITIEASDVTLDLNGYTLQAEAGASGSGISSALSTENIKIGNGSIIGWAARGINLASSTFAQVYGVTVRDNNGDGIAVGNHSQVTNCVALSNNFDGIDVGDFCTVLNSTASYNIDNGIEGDSTTTLKNIRATHNNGSGIAVGQGSNIHLATAIENNENGVEVGNGSMVNQCVSTDNGIEGYALGSAVHASQNTARDNAGNGFSTLSDSHLYSNTADGNSLSGFTTTSSDVRFDGNQSTDNGQYGFDVISTFGCVLMKNTAANNAVVNYNLSVNNAAPIISSGTITSATNPFANIDF